MRLFSSLPFVELLVLATTLPLVGCGDPSLPAATGAYAEIVLAHEGPSVSILRDTLEASVHYLGQTEPRFRVQAAGFEQLDSLSNHKNLILAVILGDGKLAQRAKRILRPEHRQRVLESGAGWFHYADVFARGQRVVVLAARSSAALDSLQRSASAQVRETLEQSTIERITHEIQSLSQRGAMRSRGADGFDIAVPPAWRFAQAQPRWGNAVELVRDAPTRIVTVFWIEGVDSVQATSPQFLRGLQRDAMWRLHGDRLVESECGFVSPAGGEAQLHGVWQNERDVGGGPFMTRFVHDPRRGRLYGVQALLFAPGRPKHPFMRELRAMLDTFRIIEEAA
ncbi:MAG: DUF4837 family protein [Candidatus Latescibacterota bacterium]|nr:MAG: DUF4837 family protein [Candidatus Latescibacterota bacterium]